MSNEEIKATDVLKELTLGASKVAISFLPGGSIFNELIFELSSRLAQQRLEEQVKLIDSKLHEALKASQDSIKIDDLKSEDFLDIFQETLRKSTKRLAKERAHFFAELCILNVCKECPDYAVDIQLQLMDIIAKLSDGEMVILKNLHGRTSPAKINQNAKTIFGLPRTDFHLCYDYLFSKGLIQDNSLSAIPTLGVGQNPQPREYIILTELGKYLIQFILEIRDAYKLVIKENLTERQS